MHRVTLAGPDDFEGWRDAARALALADGGAVPVRWVRDRRRYTGNPEAKFFFPDATPHLDRPDLVREVPHINHPDVVRLAKELQPDLICVFGTSLIRGELLQQGRLGIINLHGGLSPEYRGADCTFWALYNGEPEKIGCTLHYIDAGIDTGRLIAHVSPAVKPGDTELVLFWRAVQDSARVYAEAIAACTRPIRSMFGAGFNTRTPSKGDTSSPPQRRFVPQASG